MVYKSFDKKTAGSGIKSIPQNEQLAEELHKGKPNKIWVDKGSEFYNRSMKSWLQDNDIVMYSTHNKGKSVVSERFIRILKNKIYK